VHARATHYVDNDGVSIAYQVVGDGPIDLALVIGSWWHLEFQWTDPGMERFLERLASFSRLILFDKRGTGLSDRVSDDALPDLELRMDDLRAVLDAVGSERCALVGESEGGPLAVLFAATYPARVSHLVLYGSYARLLSAPDYPAGVDPSVIDAFIEATVSQWGTAGPMVMELFAPSLGEDAAFAEWLGAMNRHSVSPGAMRTLMQMMAAIDVRSVLPAVAVPTLVVHREGDRVCTVENGRYLASAIPDARYVELPGDDHTFSVGDSDSILGEVEEFITGSRSIVEEERLLLTVVFTDIVDSTSQAARLGDSAWRGLLDRHDAMVRRELERHRGREVKHTGDGFLLVFDGPARAVRCAAAIRDGARAIGIAVRAGVHTGECEIRGDDVGGIAVHIAARVSALADADEVLVSSTVRDLTAGSALTFEDRGEHDLRGVPGPWRIHALRGDERSSRPRR
jgi:class 3 adenylate cyclase